MEVGSKIYHIRKGETFEIFLEDTGKYVVANVDLIVEVNKNFPINDCPGYYKVWPQHPNIKVGEMVEIATKQPWSQGLFGFWHSSPIIYCDASLENARTGYKETRKRKGITSE